MSCDVVLNESNSQPSSFNCPSNRTKYGFKCQEGRINDDTLSFDAIKEHSETSHHSIIYILNQLQLICWMCFFPPEWSECSSPGLEGGARRGGFWAAEARSCCRRSHKGKIYTYLKKKKKKSCLLLSNIIGSKERQCGIQLLDGKPLKKKNLTVLPFMPRRLSFFPV